MRTTTLITRAALVTAVGVFAAACGSDDATDDTATTAAPTAEPADEPAEAPAEQPAEEPAEAPADEPAEESAEAPAEEPAGDETESGDEAAFYEGEVAAMIVRRVPGDLETFTSTRDAYVADLESQPGIEADREFQPFLSFLSFAEPDPAVYIGLTEGSSLPEFGAAADAIDPTLVEAYFPTFEIEAFTFLRPLEGDTVDIDAIAAEPGQVLEIAWRDLSAYDDFDQAAYETARDDYLAALAAFDGSVAEYQWVSADGGTLAVGMTVYESAEAFQAIATDPDFTASEVYEAFVGGYPIAGGYASNVLK